MSTWPGPAGSIRHMWILMGNVVFSRPAGMVHYRHIFDFFIRGHNYGTRWHPSSL